MAEAIGRLDSARPASPRARLKAAASNLACSPSPTSSTRSAAIPVSECNSQLLPSLPLTFTRLPGYPLFLALIQPARMVGLEEHLIWASRANVMLDLATALLVAGPDEGLAMARTLGLEALWLLRRDGALTAMGLGRFDDAAEPGHRVPACGP